MELKGTVRNVIDFGAFVDIGVHQDGLVHVSQISDKFIKNPRDVLKVGDVMQVKVLSVDTAKSACPDHERRAPEAENLAENRKNQHFSAEHEIMLPEGKAKWTV